MPLQDRNLIEEKLSEVLVTIRDKRKIVNDLKNELTHNGISTGETQYIVTGKKPLNELSISVLCLLAAKIYNLTEIEASNPENYFTPQEIKQCQAFEVTVDEDKISLPYTFENVTFVRDSNFSTTITAQEIKKLMDSNLLIYNFETQREARIERDKDDNIIYKPKTNPKSVAEIADLLKTGDLETTTITFNALANTSDEGAELVYDHKNRTLIITKGTQINILDGYHRISAVMKALTEDSTLDTVFDLKILNYSTRRAIKYFNQINKTNPVAESRRKETDLTSMATTALEELKEKCQFFEGKISSSDRIFRSVDQLVSAKVLIEAIDEHFNPSNRIEALQTGQYLAKFFNELFMTYPEAFVTNIAEVRKQSIINANFMFDAYIFLAKKLQELNQDVNQIKNIFDKIDFSRKNELWKQIGALDDAEHVAKYPKKNIRKFILDLVTKEVGTSV